MLAFAKSTMICRWTTIIIFLQDNAMVLYAKKCRVHSAGKHRQMSVCKGIYIIIIKDYEYDAKIGDFFQLEYSQDGYNLGKY